MKTVVTEYRFDLHDCIQVIVRDKVASNFNGVRFVLDLSGRNVSLSQIYDDGCGDERNGVQGRELSPLGRHAGE